MEFLDFRYQKNVFFFDKANMRLDYLKRQPSTVSIIASPDYGEKGIINNGMYLETKDELYPLFPGFDIGCGFYTCFFCGNCAHVQEKMYKYTTLSYNECDNVVNNFDNKMNYSVDIINNISIRLQPGNHFIELRKVCDLLDPAVCDKLGISMDTYALMIHMGSGKTIEEATQKYVLQCIRRCPQADSSSQNGYLIKLPSNSSISEKFIAHAFLCSDLAYSIRRFIAKYLLDSVKVLFEFDAPHDFIYKLGNRIYHYKSIQPFRTIRNENLALMPGDIDDMAYLVKEGSLKYKYMNHGLIHSIDEKRRFETAATTISHCWKIGLCTPVTSLYPICVIKNVNDKLILKH